MALHKLFACLFRPGSSERRKPRRPRLDCEELEPRTVPSSIPFLFTNQTDRQVNFLLYGIDNSTGQWSYFRADSSTGDTFAGSLAPAQQLGAGNELPTYSFAGPSATLMLPDAPAGISSAAIVMTVGAIAPSITVASNFTLPRPAPSNPSLVNATTNPYYDYIEFTLDPGNTLNINTTQVDQFGFPITLTSSPEPEQGAVGVTPGLSRDAIFQAFVTFLGQESDPAAEDFLPLLQTAENGSPYRIIAPGQYLAIPGKSSDSLAGYFDSAIQSFFTAPPALTLIAGGMTFVGTATTHNPVASGDPAAANPADDRDFRVLDFVAQNGALAGQHFYIYSPIDPPSWVHVPSAGEQVFANNGVFADNGTRFGGLQSSILGNLENQVVSALTRGIANLPTPGQYANTTAFWTDPSQAFPAGQQSNLYAKFLHTGQVNGADIFIDGRVYAFPYSDQGDQAAFFAVNNPASVSVTLGPWSGSTTASAASGAITFAVIGDYGSGSSNEGNVANRVKSWNPDFIITTGDNNYGSGSADTIDDHIGQFYYEYIGNYTGSYGPGSATNRFFPSLGNHDWGTPGAQPYLDYFTLPGNERYYNFTQGPVEFFAIDSDDNEPDGILSNSVQGQWLQSKLAASTATWKLVYFHHSPYSSGSHGSETDLQWPFLQWGASAVLTGHDHTYERLLVNNLPYFVNGLGGASKYSFGSPVAGSQVRYNADYGAMRVTADDSQITFQFITQAGTVIDTYTVSAANTSPTITSGAAPTSAPAGSAYSYQFTAAGNPAPTLSASGLPAWLTFNTGTGLLTGTPPSAAVGSSAAITLTASNGILPNAVMSFTINVTQASAATVTVSPSSLSLGTTTTGTAGAVQTFTVSGSNLTGNLGISAPAGVQLSLDGNTWSAALNLAPNGAGTVAATTIRARIAASASAGAISGSIAATSSGAATKNVAVSGTVSESGTPTLGTTLYLLSPGALSAVPGTNAQSDTIASAGGTNHDGTPTNARVYEVHNLFGTYDSSRQTEFTLYVDVGAQSANGTQAQVSYDFTGDGVYDRVETYRYFAEDAQPGWEAYTEAAGLRSAAGSFANFQNGRVKLEVWNAIGQGAVALRTDATASQGQQSEVRLPFANLPPTSSVYPLPQVTTSPSFTVSWNGSDATGGSGVRSYDVFVSDNGGPFTLWRDDSAALSAVYQGVVGHRYAFYSVATDNAGNVQPTPTGAQATTVAGSSAMTLRNTVAGWALRDDATGTLIISSAQLGANPLTIGGAGSQNDRLTVDFRGGSFTLPAGSRFAAGGGTDRIHAVGNVSFALTNGGLSSGAFRLALSGVERALLTGGSGNNKLNAAAFTGKATLRGGAGNDTLIGGPAHDVLVGGSGNDYLLGNNGRDLLVGGGGRDNLKGGDHADILIAGATRYDASVIALDALMKEWIRATTYSSRTRRLQGTLAGGLNRPYYLKSSTLPGDGAARDVLTGGSGTDWFLAKALSDVLKDKARTELFTATR